MNEGPRNNTGLGDLEWWAYRHTEGSLHVKRYFGKLDIAEAKESPFVDQVTGPFRANNNRQAREIATARLPEIKVPTSGP